MIRYRNGESQSEPEQSKPRRRFTGQVLRKRRPQTYKRIVNELSDPTCSIRQIARRYRVSQNTVEAIKTREAETIAEKRERLTRIFADLAEDGATRAGELVGEANVRDAITLAGISVDKLLALLGDTGGVPVNVSVQVNAAALHEQYRQLIEALPKEPEPPPNDLEQRSHL